MKFTGKLIGEFGGVNMYEIEVDQENGTIFVYEISESDLEWLNKNNKSKWDVKYVSSLVRTFEKKETEIITNSNKQRGNMETIFNILGNMKLTKSQRSQIAMLLATSFTNGFHAALIDRVGIATESQLNVLTTQSEICQHIMFLERENSK